jgi:transposase
VRIEELAAENAALRARVDELTQQVAVLSRLLFGTSSEQRAPDPGDTGASAQGAGGAGLDRSADVPAGRGRGQQRGGPGHGRRDHTHLESEERFHDLPEGERTCGTCGLGFEFLGSEASEQIDWHVKIVRIVHRRLRYRRRCTCPGPRTVIAPAVAQPVPKGLYTAAFLARLLMEKHVLGRPVHRLAKALTEAPPLCGRC